MIGVIALLLTLLAAAPAAAQSPLVAELREVSTRYHEQPARLDAIYHGLQEALRTDSHVDNLLALAQAAYIWGDVRARTTEEKLEAYERGRQAAQRAVELAPRNAWAHFWLATTAGRWGQTKGIMRSLFLLPTVKEGMRNALELDPSRPAFYSLAGQVHAEVPGFLGGDLDRAEDLFRKGLQLDPRYTGLRVGLARALARKGRREEARREAEAVLAETTPRNPADWTVKDVPQARALLESLRGRP